MMEMYEKQKNIGVFLISKKDKINNIYSTTLTKEKENQSTGKIAKQLSKNETESKSESKFTSKSDSLSERELTRKDISISSYIGESHDIF